MKPLLIAGLAVALAAPAFAQTDTSGARPTVERNTNNTGGGRDVSVSRGATGADTVDTNSAAAGNANQPSRAVPQGSGGGGSGTAGGN